MESVRRRATSVASVEQIPSTMRRDTSALKETAEVAGSVAKRPRGERRAEKRSGAALTGTFKGARVALAAFAAAKRRACRGQK